jgi:hypothetical protein
MYAPHKEVVIKWTIAVTGLIPLGVASASAQKLDVKIIDRPPKLRLPPFPSPTSFRSQPPVGAPRYADALPSNSSATGEVKNLREDDASP